MTTKIKIRKTVIKKRSDELAQAIIEVLKKSKKIKTPSAKKQEQELFYALMKERQSMKKAHAFRKWKLFVTKQFAEEQA